MDLNNYYAVLATQHYYLYLYKMFIYCTNIMLNSLC